MRLHAPLDHFAELPGIVAVRIDARIGAEGDLRAGLQGMAEILALQPAYFLFLLDGLREHAGLRAFLQNEIVVVNIKHQVRAVLLGQRDAFVIDQAGVLDGIDAAREWRP